MSSIDARAPRVVQPRDRVVCAHAGIWIQSPRAMDWEEIRARRERRRWQEASTSEEARECVASPISDGAAPLKQALREVRDRETGMQLNAVREAIEAASAAKHAELAAQPSSSGGSARSASTSRCPQSCSARCRPAPRAARCTRRRRSARRRGHLPRPRLRDRRRPRGRDDALQLRRARLPRLASRALAARVALPRRRHGAAHRDVAGADPQDGGAAARRSTWSRSAACTGATRSTRRTSRSSTSSRASRSTRASRWPTSRGRCST